MMGTYVVVQSVAEMPDLCGSSELKQVVMEVPFGYLTIFFLYSVSSDYCLEHNVSLMLNHI